MNQTVKCRYKYCKHGSRDLDRNEAVLIGKSTYYHKDCFKESRTIDKIIDTFATRVEPDPVFAALRKIVNNIVIKDKVDAEYLLFALNFAADHKMIKHPPGLYYIAKNDRIKKEWNKLKTAEFMREEKNKKQQYINSTTREFNYKPPKQKTISSMFGNR